jgi:transcription initiation factor TFIID subunit 7
MSGLKIKLNLNTGPPKDPSAGSPPITTTLLPTPGGSRPKFTIQTKTKSTPSTPATDEPPKPKKTKAGRTAKPSAKLLESKKRIKEESDDEADEEGATINVQPSTKKIKLSLGNLAAKTPTTATPSGPLILKAKAKGGKVPSRAPGRGYDSEASDREIDPVIEEELILRMPPSDDCDYLRKAIEDKKIGISKQQGGAEVQMKFFDLHGRRGAVTVRKNVYAFVLVDLPCIIEGMKSWDRRGWWKSADICQMLWVFAPVPSEEAARTIPVPPEVDANFQYPHGITAPMRYVRKLRFRKRLQRSVIEQVEEEVNKLLADDDNAIHSGYELIDHENERRASQFNGSTPGYDHDDEEDAEGEDDDDDPGYFGHQPVQNEEEEVELLDEDFEKELEDAMVASENDAPASEAAETPSILPAAETEEDSGDDSFDDDDGDDDKDMAPAEVSEEEKARLAKLQGAREDIAELEEKIRKTEATLATVPNAILQMRLKADIRKLQQEIQLKKSSIGEDENIE